VNDHSRKSTDTAGVGVRPQSSQLYRVIGLRRRYIGTFHPLKMTIEKTDESSCRLGRALIHLHPSFSPSSTSDDRFRHLSERFSGQNVLNSFYNSRVRHQQSNVKCLPTCNHFSVPLPCVI